MQASTLNSSRVFWLLAKDSALLISRDLLSISHVKNAKTGAALFPNDWDLI
jgi:hypothetical protein